MLLFSSRDFNINHPIPKPYNKTALGTKRKVLADIQAALDYKDELFSWSRDGDFNITDHLMSKAIHTGKPTRLKNVLRKVLRAEDVNLVILGGSNSAGGYLGADEKNLDGLYFRVFTNWWNKTIGKVTNASVKTLQLAFGGTGSYFFAYCYETFIVEDENIDIVLIEVSVNDGSDVKPLEQLTRQVLAHPSAPAVLYINLVTRVGPRNPSCVNLESFGQSDVARHYDVASISLKEVLCRKEKGKWRAKVKSMTASDGHVNANAHALVAMVMIKYVRSVFKELINDVLTDVYQVEGKRLEGQKRLNLPKLLFIERETEALKNPLCWTGKTPDVSKRLHRPNLQLRIINNEGFSTCLLPKKTKPLRPDTGGGWCAWKQYSILKLSIIVPRLTINDVISSRSVTIMILNGGGHAVVWLDNSRNKTAEFKRIDWGCDQYHTIGTRVSPGHHNLTVITVRDGLLVVSGVFVGPPDTYDSHERV